MLLFICGSEHTDIFFICLSPGLLEICEVVMSNRRWLWSEFSLLCPRKCKLVFLFSTPMCFLYPQLILKEKCAFFKFCCSIHYSQSVPLYYDFHIILNIGWISSRNLLSFRTLLWSFYFNFHVSLCPDTRGLMWLFQCYYFPVIILCCKQLTSVENLKTLGWLQAKYSNWCLITFIVKYYIILGYGRLLFIEPEN